MKRSLVGMVLALATALAAPGTWGADNRFCGGPVVRSGEPTDLASEVGDMTLEAMSARPASMLVCAHGYLLEKCGDHETAHHIFDKCIAAGYVGAMIWKALLLEEGVGVPRDPVAATALMRRAATSGDSPYATLGKLHYASALFQGRGVARDEAEARRWFEAAAADGNPDAIDFLRTGYHVGERDASTRGVGTPPAESGAPPLPAELREEPVAPAATPAPRQATGPFSGDVARRLGNVPAPSAAAAPPERAAVPVASQRLARVEVPVSPAAGDARGVAVALLGFVLSGALCQALRGRRLHTFPVLSGA